jgi:hypothetical protein
VGGFSGAPCNNARVHLALLAFDRESAIISALIALIVAGVIVSVGAWVLLRRERRRVAGARKDR